MEPPPLPPPLPDTSAIYIGTSGHVCAINTGTGTTLWKTALSSKGLFGETTTRADTSVLVRDGFVYAGVFGHLFCLDAKTGRILWKNELPGLGHNDVSLSMEGVSLQIMTKVVRQST
jgi:outer membrane protein assembly factor BamB